MCVPYSGALIGPDVHKILKSDNIRKIGKIFKATTFVKNDNADEAVFGSPRLQNKVITLLRKIQQCYTLYTANRSLCRHEVELLALWVFKFWVLVPG